MATSYFNPKLSPSLIVKHNRFYFHTAVPCGALSGCINQSLPATFWGSGADSALTQSTKWGHPAASKLTPFCLHCWEWPLGTGKGEMATQITGRVVGC